MFGAHPPRSLARVPGLARCLRLRWCVLLLFLSGSFVALAQTVAPVEPVIPADPTSPALPTDPTAPPVIQTPSSSTIPLISAPPLPASDPRAFPATSVNPLTGTGTLPGASSAVPLPGPSPAPTTTTNNIGTARRFQYTFGLTLGATYDDNIFLQPAQVSRDLYFTIQPSVSLGLGGGVAASESANYFRLNYSPEVLLYVDHSELDTVQQFFSLAGAYHLPKITLTGSLGVQLLDSTDVGNPHPLNESLDTSNLGVTQPGTPINNNPVSSVNLDTGQRTRLNLYTAALDANYYVSDKVSYDLAGQISDSDYATLLSSITVSGSAFFNYSPTAKTTLGFGVTAGYVFADRPTPDQSFEQGNLRLSYSPSLKLLVAGQVGLELRQSTAQTNMEVTPIFDLNASYAPFDGTSLSLEGNRQVLTSAVLGGQDYTLTGLTISVSQRFFQRLYLRLSAGYSHTDYRAETNDPNTPRSDDYFFVQPGLDYNLRNNVTVGGFYSFRTNLSDQSNRNFTDDQVGIRLSLLF